MTAGVQLFPPTFDAWMPADPDRAVAVLMSGGVDSSVTALLLREAGWEVVGITMRVPALEGACSTVSPCCGADAALVCEKLRIPHYFVEVREAFHKYVVQAFRQAYMEGRTPNPCVDCNRFLKFNAVWQLVEEQFGIRNAATGHYARIEKTAAGVYLAAGRDARRDQSYFIYGIARERLPFFHLPMGEHNKADVRRIAAEHRLGVEDKPDSMELCFAGEGDYRTALGLPTPEPGPIVDINGKAIGEHTGIWNYTIGQRRGLGIAAGEPRYVIAIDATANSVTVGTREEAGKRSISAGDLNVLIPEQCVEGAQLQGKIRSYSPPAACTVTAMDDTGLQVRFSTPQFAPTPGQHLVLYDGHQRVVAGGDIQACEKD
jgi:tRNA-specific 2-thiouridylase